MKTTIPKLRRMIRKVIQEHTGGEHHEHGDGYDPRHISGIRY